MDYWYDIIENYDPPKVKGNKSKDHGESSQKSTVILLMYLTFGADYSSGIAEYFNKLKERKVDCPSILTNANKTGSVLKRMNKDNLVKLRQEVNVTAGTRKYYELNPQILRSPIKDSIAYIKSDGSSFSIPLETIEGFLRRMSLKRAGTIDKHHQEQLDKEVRQARHERADKILIDVLTRSEKVNYRDFLSFIEAEAKRNDLHKDSRNQQSDLSDLIHGYIFETNKEIREWESCVD